MNRIQLNYVSDFMYTEEDILKDTPLIKVIKAYDVNLKRNVCIKQIRVNEKNRKEKEQAINEAVVMQKYSEQTPFIPQIYFYTFDEKHQTLNIVMEWINGETLTEIMSVQNFPLNKFLNYMIELCDILICFEKNHESHKDIKPDNIMIDKKNHVHLIDFNITYSLTNLIEGTPYYKAPEMDGKIIKCVDRSKVDQFSIGVMLYEFTTKNLPKNLMHYYVKDSHAKKEWDKFVQPKQLNEKISDSLNSIICTCMKLDPKDRYASLSKLKQDLERACHEKRKYKK